MDPFEHPAVWCWYFWWCYDRLQWVAINRPFGAGHLRGAKLPRLGARYALGQDKRITSSKMIIFFVLSRVPLTLRLLHICYNAPYLPPLPPKFCITVVFHFSWVLQPSQEKLKKMLMPSFFGGRGVGAKKVHALLEMCKWPIQHGGFVLWERLAAQGLNELNQGHTDAMIFKYMLTRFWVVKVAKVGVLCLERDLWLGDSCWVDRVVLVAL